MRYEPPDESNRWDSPLFRLEITRDIGPQSISIPFDDIYRVLFEVGAAFLHESSFQLIAYFVRNITHAQNVRDLCENFSFNMNFTQSMTILIIRTTVIYTIAPYSLPQISLFKYLHF